MSKRYVLSKEDLQNLLHESISFFSVKSRESIDSGKRIMFSDRVKWIDDFLSKMLIEFPVDQLMDDIEKAATCFLGKNLDEIKNDMRKRTANYDEDLKRVKEHLKLMEGKDGIS